MEESEIRVWNITFDENNAVEISEPLGTALTEVILKVSLMKYNGGAFVFATRDFTDIP